MSHNSLIKLHKPIKPHYYQRIGTISFTHWPQRWDYQSIGGNGRSECLYWGRMHTQTHVCKHVPKTECTLCFQMSDRGGGVPFRRTERLFSYMYSTAPRPCIGDKHRAPLVSRYASLQTHTITHTLDTTEELRYVHGRVCVGRVWLRAAHLPSLRPLFPGRLTAVFHGREWNWRHHPPEGNFNTKNYTDWS